MPLPSAGPRISVDGTSAALPFGDGPGLFPGFPEGTQAFWEGTGNAKKIWEIVACPVADTVSFLEMPLRCVLGVDEYGKVGGSILDFFANIDGAEILEAMKKAAIPLAVAFMYNFSGLVWLEKVRREEKILKEEKTLNDQFAHSHISPFLPYHIDDAQRMQDIGCC